jgi:hypothetical protein
VALFLIPVDIISVRHYNKYIATKDRMKNIKNIVDDLIQRTLYWDWQFVIAIVLPFLVYYLFT